MNRIARIASRIAYSRPGPRPRSFFLGQSGGVHDLQIEKIEGTSLEIYTYEDDDGWLHAAGFYADKARPWWSDKFGREDARRRAIEESVLRLKEKEQKHVKGHNLDVGDIVVFRPRGRVRTLEFHQVVDIGEMTVMTREIASRVERVFDGDEYVVPVSDSFGGPEIERKARFFAVEMRSSETAKKWDGTPQVQI
jgi:hypothetical protein